MFDTQNNQWTEIFPGTQPIPRVSHTMAYDSVNQRIILFGGLGNNYTEIYNDTWAFNCTNNKWSFLTGTYYSESKASPGFEVLLVLLTLIYGFSLVKRQR